MKPSTKETTNLISGIALLLSAAFFSICLLLQFFDFGTFNSENILLNTGKMLYAVYGFSSILIPTFLLIAGLSCFASKWTARKAFRLLTAMVPFFTCVICEKIIRSVVNMRYQEFPIVKVVIIGITGLMLVIIEFVAAGIIADKINGKTKTVIKKTKKIVVQEAPVVKEEKVEKKSRFFKIDEKKEPEEEEEDISEDFGTYQDDGEDEEEAEKPGFFARLKEKFAKPKKEESERKAHYFDIDEDDAKETELERFEEPEEKQEIHPAMEAAFTDYDIPVITEDETIVEEENQETTVDSDETIVSDIIEEEVPVENIPDDVLDETLAEEFNEQPSEDETISLDDEDDSGEPVPLLSNEEFAALTNFSDEPERVEEELEWNNVPPAPASLPADYLDEPEDQPSYIPPVEYDEPTPEDEPHPVMDDYAPDADDPFAAANFIQNKVNHQAVKTVAVTKTAKAVPSYPSTIDFSDYEETVKNEPVKKETEKSKYGTKISFAEEEEEEASVEQVEVPSAEEDFTDDINSNAFDTEFAEDSYPEPLEEEQDFLMDAEPEQEPVSDQIIDDAFFDAGFDDELEEENESENLEDDISADISDEEETETPASIFSVASDVFSDMDKDIRENAGIPEDEMDEDEPVQEEEETVTEYVLYEGSKIPVEKKKASNPNAEGARNLTPDELTDFFNAQEKANKPVHSTIVKESAPKNSSRARKKGPYIIPSDMLTAYEDDQYWVIDDATKEASIDLKNTLAEFNIEAEITGIKKGPVVTMYEILPAPGVKLSKIVALQDNIALRLAAKSVRIVAPIPGKRAVGIEVPNKNRSIVGFREIIEQNLEEYKKMAIPVVLGKDILGKAQLLDLVKTPHLLIAGATGAGKSVCVNSIILSILFKRSPDEVKLIMVDPKVVELKLYNDIPHLLTPVITESKKALQALQYCIVEMERRYSLLDHMGVRDISSYNKKIKEQKIATEKLPYIIVIIDEFADLMATTGKETENVVARLTAMSRAVGIHLVLATQRPSVNVITGLIKANIPSRIAFMVASRTDSGIIIDSPGAEKLLGRGDMLYASAVDPNPVRIQGTFISDEEVESVVEKVKEYGEPDYIDEDIFLPDEEEQGELFENGTDFGEDPLYDEALQVVVQAGKASASYIQRRLKIGYNRAARLIEEMEERGIIGPQNGSKPREILYIP